LRRQEKEAKEGDAKSLPCGYPPVQVKKWEMKQTRYAQTSFIPYPFSAMHKRQRHMRKAKINTSVVRLPSLRKPT
jgi:hypothetical protein